MIRQKALATDQRILIEEMLTGRSLTCQQAGRFLESVKLGLMQRMLAFEVLPGRLTDLPDGLPQLLEVLSGSIRRDVEVALRSPRPAVAIGNRPMAAPELMPVQPLTLSNGARSPSARSLPRDRRKPDWPECVDRLRVHVMNGEVSPALHQDLAAVFEALNLGPLPAPRDESYSASSSSAFNSAASTASTVAPPAYSRSGLSDGLAPSPPGTLPPQVSFAKLPPAGKGQLRPESAKSIISDESV